MKKYFLGLSEIVIILIVFLVIDNYLGRQELLIKSDGKGYYEYLPAAFIYHDLNFQYADTLVTKYYDHKSYGQGYLKTINGFGINKYFPGASILWIPFFTGSHIYALNSDYPPDGFSLPYQMGVYAAALFYLWLGLFFLRKILRLKNTPYPVIFLIQLAFAIGTPILNYVHFDASFVHVYSFTLINMLVYFMFKYIETNKINNMVYAGMLLGIIMLVRPVNAMAVLFFFLGFNSYPELKQWFVNRVEHSKTFWRHLLVAVGSFALVASLAPILWKYQTGQFFIWGYQGESFNFLSPTVFNFLFSSRKGLFIHTPLLGLLFFTTVFLWIKAKKIYPLVSFILVAYIIVYVLSSWWSWYYGTSFGSRASIDYYIFFALLTAQLFALLKSKITKVILAIVIISMIPVNIIQAYQYQHYIMDWDEMTFEKFNFIRLNTEDKYRGVFFQPKPNYKMNQVQYHDSISFPEPLVTPHGATKVILEVPFKNTVENPISNVHLNADLGIETGQSDFIVTVYDTTNQMVLERRLNNFKSIKKDNSRGMGDYYYSVEKLPINGRFVFSIQTWNDEVSVYFVKVNLVANP